MTLLLEWEADGGAFACVQQSEVGISKQGAGGGKVEMQKVATKSLPG